MDIDQPDHSVADFFQVIPPASSCDNYQKSGRRNKRSSSSMGFSSPNQGIIILPDQKPAKGSGFKDPIEIDEEVEVLGVMKMSGGSCHKNPIIVGQERPHHSGVRTLRLHSKRSHSSNKTFMKAPWAGKPVIEIGESSGTTFQELMEMEMGDSSGSVSPQPDFICEICTEAKYPHELFAIEGCSHTCCKSCLNQYVTSKVENNMLLIKCPCPDCEYGKLEPAMCSSILEDGVFDRWCKALCESMVNDKFYCPFKDCSALMINDTENAIIDAKCPHCSRLFCAQCRVPWHAGFSCSEFQKLDNEERQNENLMLMKLAKMSQWQRCPNCKFFVERIDGCMFMKCRRMPIYTQGDTKLWDISGNAFDSMEGAGILEVANISLDEPKMEAILFKDDENDDIEIQEL